MPIELDLDAIGLKTNALWPTLFHVADYPGAASDKPALVDLARRLQRTGESWGVAPRAKQGLYESRPRLFDAPETRGLAEFCRAIVAHVLTKEVVFVESWVHVTNDGGWHDAHAHVDFARQGICGIYYVQIGDCTGDPPNGINRFYSANVWDDHDVADFVPVEGRLLLFPGHVRHAALPYRGREDRIVFSFNARLRDPAPPG